jgi:ADP-ribose pyrophosphatase YjhB (NUDIX family)
MVKDMKKKNNSRWLLWAREIQALAQTGNTYAQNEFDTQRYHRLTEIAAEIIASHSNLTENELMEIYKGQQGYATPKVDLRSAVFNTDGELLMVQERIDGTWTMPGGWADVGDVPSEGAEREVWEEAGFKVKAAKVVGVYNVKFPPGMILFHLYKIVYLCDLIEGKARPSIETTDVRFFKREDIPEDLLGFRTTVRHIDDAFKAHTDSSLPTVFD